MFKLFALFAFFLLSFLSSISANDVVPGAQYRTTDAVKTLSGTTIDAGELVEALAVSDVADIVSTSGQITKKERHHGHPRCLPVDANFQQSG